MIPEVRRDVGNPQTSLRITRVRVISIRRIACLDSLSPVLMFCEDLLWSKVRRIIQCQLQVTARRVKSWLQDVCLAKNIGRFKGATRSVP